MTHSDAAADEVRIHVSGIEPARGGVLTAMIFAKDGYPKKHAKALLTQSVPANETEMDFVFTVTHEQIAVKIHHDEDENGKVAKNWTGIYPAEGLGFSNKQKIKFTGPPSFKKSRINKAQFGEVIEIKLLYGKKKK